MTEPSHLQELERQGDAPLGKLFRRAWLELGAAR
jgi:hypothetical protein